MDTIIIRQKDIDSVILKDIKYLIPSSIRVNTSVPDENKHHYMIELLVDNVKLQDFLDFALDNIKVKQQGIRTQFTSQVSLAEAITKKVTIKFSDLSSSTRDTIKKTLSKAQSNNLKLIEALTSKGMSETDIEKILSA